MKRPPKIIPSATLADLEALPRTWRGEIIDGTLYAVPRPRARHANIALLLGADLANPYQRGRSGPGGWWILPEPGIKLPRSPEFSPDLAGWRLPRIPRLPPPKKAITIVPDWVCEILSPGTASYDNIVKRRFYAEIGVGHIWYVDPARRELEICRLVDGKWLQLGVFGADEKVRGEPFEAVEIDLAGWWAGMEEGEDEDEGVTTPVSVIVK